MKNLKMPIFGALAAAMAATMIPANVGAAATGTVPIEAWALRDVISNVQISPDGKHIMVMKLESKEGEYIMEIYETADMSKPLRRLNADPMEIIGARWVTGNKIFGTAWEVVRKSVKGPEGDVRSYKSFAYDLKSNKFSETAGNYDIVNSLPKDPDNVLIAEGRAVDGGTGVDPFQAFRPQAYYKFNLNTGAKSLLLKGSEKYPTATFDDDGNPRFTSSFDPNTNEQKFYYRAVGDNSWKEMDERYDLDDHENLYRVLGGFQGLAGFNAEDPNMGYFIDARGEDKAALYDFDFRTGKIGKKIYGNPDADIIDIQRHSMASAGNGKMVAAIYPGAKFEREWFDADEQALYESLEKQIPNAHAVRISSRSRDGSTMIVNNSGPHDPGSFWLVKGGKMTKLGSRNPLLKPEDLSDVEFIKYPARDGRMIPAYVTKPKGAGPFPLVVLPHGGPHVNEVVGFDEWGQLLANNGYMVLQPEYRMSTGWGKDHFDSAYGQHGLAMQDDKDDGALYLVNQGLVDKDRMAMFGWSYGGYAALVATTREPQIYQCAIAGAAVADPEKGYRDGRSSSTPKALDDWAKRRGTIGINPINEVAKSNIPLLMVHGDVDRRVLYYNYEDYKKAMERAGKTNAQFLTLKGADHFYTTLMYNHQEAFFTKMLDFLANDCGPGGL